MALQSRRQRSLTRFFPEIVAAVAELDVDVVLNGELVLRREGRVGLPRVAGPGFRRVHRDQHACPLTITPAEYIAAVRRYRDEIGGLDRAAPQDRMCEPEQLAMTGLKVEEHQRRTVDSFVELRDLAPDLPVVPVAQG